MDRKKLLYQIWHSYFFWVTSRFNSYCVLLPESTLLQFQMVSVCRIASTITNFCLCNCCSPCLKEALQTLRSCRIFWSSHQTELNTVFSSPLLWKLHSSPKDYYLLPCFVLHQHARHLCCFFLLRNIPGILWLFLGHLD